MLSICGLSFGYKGNFVLRTVKTDFNNGQVTGIVGPNGAGKTSLLKCIARIVGHFEGSILIDGNDTGGMKRHELARRLSYVPQSAGNRFPVSVFDTVLMGRRPHMTWKPSGRDLKKVTETLKEMGLEALAMRDVDQISGGQMQKVLLARAVCQEADYLLLDEPTSSLDLRHQLEVMEMITSLVREKNVGAVMAMHDLNLASRFSDKIVMLDQGRVFCEGKPFDVITTENIRAVYGVNAAVIRNKGYPYVLPESMGKLEE